MPNARAAPKTDKVQRLRLEIQGAVQGVGFRPHVYRLAHALQLRGWVANSGQGVTVDIEGDADKLERFLHRLQSGLPPLARITAFESRWLQPAGQATFHIRPSLSQGPRSAQVLPDIATCPDCLRELFDSNDRRYRYPFLNCTHCGPRYSIVQSLPYDRPRTTMRRFSLCPSCQSEYNDSGNRRFHAQPTACPRCGPALEYLGPPRSRRAAGEAALQSAERLLVDGKILALKGVGGFQLLVDARNAKAVERLRQRKGRGPKPFALMCPSLEYARNLAWLGEPEAALLSSAAAPIVLLLKRSRAFEYVAPDVPDYGIMLPYSPLHHMLMFDLGFPVVATSGNRSEEPICIENDEALQRLGQVADGFLWHNRPIARQVDDSVARILLGKEQVLRRARGYAPLPLATAHSDARVLAVGAHLKNSIALLSRNQIVCSQHIGDLETAEAYHAFENAVRDLPALMDAQPERIAHDLHPDYLSTRFAQQSLIPKFAVQHHLAHVYACLLDNDLPPPALGFAWDGTGYGLDGSVWGGEAFLVTPRRETRVASFHPFPLYGGDAAARQPRRSAFALLQAAFPGGLRALRSLPSLQAFTQAELHILQQLTTSPQNPMTTSVGRLFDGVASLLDLCHVNRFEGQAAMLLEAKALENEAPAPPFRYVISVRHDPSGNAYWRADWRPMLRQLTEAIFAGQSPSLVAHRFHQTLCDIVFDLAKRIRVPDIVFSGGCFQNRLLCESLSRRFEDEPYRIHFHQRIPPNDGGVAAGQAYAASRARKPNLAPPPCA